MVGVIGIELVTPVRAQKPTTKTFSHHELKTADHRTFKLFDDGYPVLD
jgi:hypothetical protein